MFFKIDDNNIIFSRSAIRSDTDTLVRAFDAKQLNNKIEQSQASKISDSELNWYVFKSLDLGWINCDLFARSRKPNINLKIKIKNAESSDVKLVFKDRYSILRGRKRAYNYYDFGNVPKDENVVLIVIKSIDDKFQLAVKETKTDNVPELNLEFKKMSILEIKKTIEALDLEF